MGEDGFEGEYLYDPYGEDDESYGEDDGDLFLEGFDLPGMDDFDPYDDPSGHLIDDLGDDDGDFDDDDDFEEG